MTPPADTVIPRLASDAAGVRFGRGIASAIGRLIPGRQAGQAGRHTVTGAEPEALARRIAGFPVISCDIFDTAIMRRLARPEDLHLATGARAAAAGLAKCVPEAFREYRLAAERAERAALPLDGDHEVPITAVYRRLQANAVVTDPDAAALLELEVERAVCRPVPELQALLQQRDSSQRLVFLSDTMLPAAWLATLLADCGYDAPEIICSADAGCTKARGGLYAIMLTRLGVSASQVVHLGDNPQSDVLQARRHGIAAVHLPAPRIPPEAEAVAHRSYILRLTSSQRRSRVVQAETGPRLDPLSIRPRLRAAAQGQPAAQRDAPLARPELRLACFTTLLGFTLYVLAEARRRGISRIFFTARDGYLPLQIARRLVARRGDPVQLSYLYCSRQAIMLPTLVDDLPRLAALIADGMLGRPLHASLQALDIDVSTTATMARAAGLDPDRPLVGSEGQQMVAQLIAAHADKIRDTLLERRSAALAYLEQSGFLAPGPRMVVDVGWRGSVQKALSRLVGAQPGDITGCYLGLWPEAMSEDFGLNDASGYLFSFGHPKWIADIVRQGYVLFELYFSASHGAVSHYAVQDGRAMPVHVEEQSPGEAIRRQAVRAIESACRSEFDNLDAVLDGAWPDNIDAASAISDMRRLLTRPTLAEVRAINRIPYIQGIDGTFSVAPVNPVPLHQLLRSPSRAARRISHAPWQAGTLRASLPWPLMDMGFPEFTDRVDRLLRLLRR